MLGQFISPRVLSENSAYGEIGRSGIAHVVCRAVGSIRWLLFQLMCGGVGRVSLLAIFFLVHAVLPSSLSANRFRLTMEIIRGSGDEEDIEKKQGQIKEKDRARVMLTLCLCVFFLRR
ncbi:hypothetical protein PIB30_056984 [Stylosanthes scabra]|uniref:Uncharacterized protein n=1 Tax=Stylosanthes scabra TaxID=79078 RepID=A0ABU6TK43_9FABA|nr:hypothetical protein [Stylosanthes scabra]